MTTTPRPFSCRRGLALLLVLASLVVSVTCAAVVVRVAATARAQRDVDRHTAWADDLARGVEPMIATWLNRDADAAVVPMEFDEPRITVVDDEWEAGGVRHALRITAYDQCGMVRWSDARSGSALRQALPDAVRSLMDRAPVGGSITRGLDLLHRDDRSTGAIVFPQPPQLPPMAFSVAPDRAAAAGVASPGMAEMPWHSAVGANVATHAPDPPVVNVNTAPLPLLERAFRESRRGGLEMVIAARKAGVSATLSTPVRPPARVGSQRTSGLPDREGLVLATTSKAWSFRVDAEVGSTRRSWWLVFTRTDTTPWSLVQRLEVIE